MTRIVLAARRTLATACLLIALAGPAGAASDALAALGRWTGMFTWDSEPARPQSVEMTFTTGAALSPTRELLKGDGTYTTDGRVTRIVVTLELDRTTGRVTITESNPSNAGFEIDGAHVGMLSDDGRRIDAVWTSRNGRRGRLELTR